MSSGSSDDSAVIILVMGIVSLVSPCLSVVCGPFIILGPILGIGAAIMGFKQVAKINAGDASEDGKVLSMIGAVTGILGVLGGVIIPCAGIGFFVLASL